MLNVVTLIGRLVRDPELRFTPQGVARCSFTIAVDRSFTNAQGEREADFIDVVVWRRLAETCAQHLQKGRLVAAHGRLEQQRWQDQQGNNRSKIVVQADQVRFLDSRRRDDASADDFDPFAGGDGDDGYPF